MDIQNVDLDALDTDIEVYLLAASVNSAGEKIYTFECYLPKFLLAELNKHRVLSGSTSSDRAIPTKSLIAEYRKNGFFKPVFWGKNKSGMSAHEKLSKWAELRSRFWWKVATEVACFITKRLAANGVHKQWTNRLLMPFIYCHHVMTGTEWENFLWLRDDDVAAQPEFVILARKVRKLIEEANNLRLLSDDPSTADGWHYAYITEEERQTFHKDPILLAKLDSARCARASYAKQGSKFAGVNKDLQTFSRLTGEKLHATPMEHPCHAYPRKQDKNFKGFRQYRTIVESTLYRK